jgi:hypothetical protein
MPELSGEKREFNSAKKLEYNQRGEGESDQKPIRSLEKFNTITPDKEETNKDY